MVKGQSRPRTRKGRRKPKWYENRAPRGVPVRVRGGPPNLLFIQTSLREWAYARAYHASAQRTHAMQPWITAYNHCRPHSALGGQPPAARLNNVLGFDT